MEKEQVVEVLSELIATCQDGEEGFRTAAEAVADPELKQTFARHSEERKTFANELDGVARRTGRAPDTSGTLAGSLHHAWMDIKSVATGGDTGAIVAEAERGEDYAVGAYRRALDAGLPEDVRAVVARQFEQVRATHDEMRALERRHAGE